MSDPLPVTAVILTRDEEVNIRRCIESLIPHLTDIHVVDSGSRDATCQIAHQLGATIHSNEFYSFGQQRNWTIDNVRHQHKWVLHLDADERMTSALAKEIGQKIESCGGFAGFYIPSKLMLGNAWLKHSGEYPAHQLRLFHCERLRFTDAGHGQREVTDGALGYLTVPYLHHPFSKGLEEWFKRHSTYARQEALEAAADQFGFGENCKRLFSASVVERRRAAKQLSRKLPFRKTIRLLHLLVLKRSLLDGRAGILYARMKALYETMIELQLESLRLGMTPPESRDPTSEEETDSGDA